MQACTWKYRRNSPSVVHTVHLSNNCFYWEHNSVKYIEYKLHATLTDVWLCYSLKPIFHCDAKPFALGTGVGLDPQRHNFALPIPTCWYLKPPTPNLKFALPPTRNRNASQWNIGCVGPQTQISCVGHVHFIFFCVDFICVQ